MTAKIKYDKLFLQKAHAGEYDMMLKKDCSVCVISIIHDKKGERVSIDERRRNYCLRGNYCQGCSVKNYSLIK